jgi:hypothetical protein
MLFLPHFNAAAAADRDARAAAVAFVVVKLDPAADGFIFILDVNNGLFRAFLDRRADGWLRSAALFPNKRFHANTPFFK